MTAFDSADGQALRRAVCAAPDDDLPRLVFADYLDESGDAADADRAAFIRAQCELERTPWMSKWWRAVSRQERPLWWKHHRALQGELAAPGQLFKRFRRGFIEDVTVGPGAFAECGQALFTAAPIRGVRVGDMTGVRGLPLWEFLAAPPVARLTRLDLQLNERSASQFPALAAAKHLVGLRSLTLPHTVSGAFSIGRELPPIVGGLRGLTDLQLVRASGSHQDAESAIYGLAACPASRRLRQLDLTGARVGDGGVAVLAESENFGGLTRLDLGDCELPTTALCALAATKSLTALEILDLSGNAALTEDDIRALADAAFAPTLKVLVVRRCGLAKTNAKRFVGLFPHAEVVV